MARHADAATWRRAARASLERAEAAARARVEAAAALALRLRDEFEEEWRAGLPAVGGSPAADVEGGGGGGGDDGADDAPLADELGVDVDLVQKRLHYVATLGFRTSRKENHALHHASDHAGGLICVVLSWMVLTAASVVLRPAHATPLLGTSILSWALGSVFVWAIIVGLSGGTGASKDALQSVMTATGYSSLALCAFLVMGAVLEALVGSAWVGALFRLCGILLASRCVGIWILRIHKMLHKQVLVVYPIVLLYSQLL